MFRLSVCLLIRSSLRSWNLPLCFTLKVLKWGISHQLPIRKHSYLDHGYLGGSASMPYVLAPGFMPRGGARGQNLGPLKKCYVAFSLMLIPSNNFMSEIRHPYDLDFCVMKWRSVWHIFHGWVILLNILKTIWWIDVKLLDNESVWCNLWPQNKCRSQWPIFHGSVVLSYILKTIWYMKVILEILDQYDFIKCM